METRDSNVILPKGLGIDVADVMALQNRYININAHDVICDISFLYSRMYSKIYDKNTKLLWAIKENGTNLIPFIDNINECWDIKDNIGIGIKYYIAYIITNMFINENTGRLYGNMRMIDLYHDYSNYSRGYIDLDDFANATFESYVNITY